MARLTNQEIKYIRDRANSILTAQKVALTARFTTAGETPSDKRMAEAILCEEVSLKHRICSTSKAATEYLNRTLREAFDFSDITAEEVLDKEAYEKAITPIKDSFTALMDEVVLGERERANRAFREFVKAFGS
jgi:hypothetical protein